VIMKLGRTFPAVRRALAAAGRLEHAVYVERASMPEQRWLPVADVDAETVPYFSLIVVNGDSLHGPRSRDLGGTADVLVSTPLAALAGSTDGLSVGRAGRPSTAEVLVSAPLAALAGSTDGLSAGRAGRPSTAERVETNTVEINTVAPTTAELLVVGLGPGPDGWLTPEVSAALAEVDHVVGYAPYVARVPQRPGLQRHASGNTVEVDRARLALDLALRGERVAVVSGGDAGVFGMAAAVFEAAKDPAYAGVPVRVLPGVSAVQAVAARAGAPIGADFAVLSLSDRLKPWEVVERRLRAVAEADLVLAIYNPASRSRTEQIAVARKVLLEHRAAGTVVVVGRDVGRAEESLTVTTLGELDPATIDMKCLLIVGASSTRVSPAGVWTPRFVEESGR
jgi:precorrin-2 C20-methyltransferase / precorrin-3B C17-methyltransferase